MKERERSIHESDYVAASELTSSAIPFPEICTSTVASTEPMCGPVTHTTSVFDTVETTHSTSSIITLTLPTVEL